MKHAYKLLKELLCLILLLCISLLSTAVLAEDISIQIVPGWNFISSPYADIPVSVDASTCGPDTSVAIPAIYHYNPSTGNYDTINAISEMKPGLGYWVYFDSESAGVNECVIKFSGTKKITTSNLGDSSDGKLVAGWNHVGGTTDSTQLTSDTGPSSKGTCEIGVIYGYNSKTGEYVATETVSGGNAYWVYVEKECKLANIEPQNQLPIAEITASTTSGNAPLKISLDASKSKDNDGRVATYSWNFGDGTSGEGLIVDHIYAAAGEYTLTLTVTDNKGGAATSSVQIKVTPQPQPIAQPAGAQLKKISPVTDKNLNGVWGTSSGVFAVGDQGTIIYYNGNSFVDMSVDASQKFNAVWGLKDSFFAVGNAGIIYHFDGSSWSKMDSGTDKDLRAIWGAGIDNVYAAGSNVVLHYDGTKWSELKIKLSSYDLYTITGRNANEIYFGGTDTDYNSLVLLYTNAKWSKVNIPNAPVYGIIKSWGNSKEIYLQGLNSIAHYDGTDWKVYPTYSNTYGQVGWVWAESANRIYYLNKGSGGSSYGTYAAIYTDDSTFTKQTGDSSISSTSAVWGDSEKNLFAVGYSGLIIHYDGQNWVKLNTKLPTPTSTSSTAYSSTTTNTNSVWGSSNNDIYILRQNLYHYNGDSWSTFSGSPTVGEFVGAWGDSRSNIVALVMYSGNRYDLINGIYKYDGTSWSRDSKSPDVSYLDYSSVRDISGSSQTDLYIVGQGGGNTVWHYDGTSWTKITTISGSNYWNSIWAPSSDNVYIAGSYYSGGYKGIIAHYDGKTWSKIDTTFATKDYSLRKIFGIPASSIYAVGDSGAALTYNENSWKEIDFGDTNSKNFYFTDIWASSINDVYVLGSLYGASARQPLMIHYDGSTWSKIDLSNNCPAGKSCSFSKIIGFNKDDIYVSGVFADNLVIFHYDGITWSKSDFTIAYKNIGKFLGFSKNDIVAIGSQGLIANYDGNTWSTLLEKGSFDNLASVEGISADNVYAVGSGKVLHFDGKTWSKISLKTLNAESYNKFLSVWGTSAQNILVAEQRGFIHYYDGATWSKIDSPVTKTVTSGGTSSSTQEDILSAWGSSKDNLFILSKYHSAAKGFEIMHYDGSKWSTITTISDYGYRTASWTRSVWGDATNNLYFINSADKSLMHFDGTAWSLVNLGTTGKVLVQAVYGDERGNVYVTGTETDSATYTGKAFIYVYDGTNWSKIDSKMSSLGDYSLGGIISGTKDNLYINDKGTTLLRYGT